MENISKIKVRTIFPPKIEIKTEFNKILTSDMVSWWERFNTGKFNMNHYLKVIQERKIR